MIWELFLILLSNALSAAVAFYAGLTTVDLTQIGGGYK